MDTQLLRHIDKTSVNVFAKDVTKRLIRRTLGLDVSLTRSRRYHVRPYSHNVKHTMRFMHFQHLLTRLQDVEGPIVECGVGPGLSLLDFALIGKAIEKPRHLFGYDTFDGLPDPTPTDGPQNKRRGGFFCYSMPHVRDQLTLSGLDEQFIDANITFVPGNFATTLPAYDKGPIALLHIDVDLYESYRTVLENLYDHMSPGGIIAFDEYERPHWPGATQAISEFFHAKPENIRHAEWVDRYYVVKE